MISLYFFGVAVEQVFAAVFGQNGTTYFIAMYVLAIIISDVPSFIKHRNNPRYNSLGASGGVAAIIFAFILFLPLENIYIFLAIPLPGFILGTGYIIYSWYQGKKSNDNINHDAHLYGALFGLLFCTILYPHAITNFFYQIRNWKVLH
jgi:membrane associated rhomboid family serine protease